MDVEAMETMLKMKGTCSPSPMKSQVIFLPSSCLLRGTSIIRLGLGFLRRMERNFLMQVLMYFSTFSIR